MRYKTHTALLAAVVVAVCALLLGNSPAAWATENAGNVIAARKNAWAERAKKEELASKSLVFSGDTLVTNPVGRLQVLFRDDSVLMMAPDSQTKITEYVYGGGKAPSFNLQLAKGMTRLISGRMVEGTPGAMKVETPVARVGIQGTIAVVSHNNGETVVNLLSGKGRAITVESLATGKVATLEANGAGYKITARGDIIRLPILTSAEIYQLSASFSERREIFEDGTTMGETKSQDAAGANVTIPTLASTNPVQSIDLNNVSAITSAPTFSGTYAGSLTGTTTASGAVSGNFSIGIANLSGAAAVNSINMSLTDGPGTVTIAGTGSNFATLDNKGAFGFKADFNNPSITVTTGGVWGTMSQPMSAIVDGKVDGKKMDLTWGLDSNTVLPAGVIPDVASGTGTGPKQ